jgi:HPt (histidine-containing phosphotransfer) domain-containing protein
VKGPRSIESNLVSFGIALGSVLVVLVLALFGVEHALGARLERMGNATMPAQQAIAGLRYAVSRLFERQVQVLSTHNEVELAALQDRRAIEGALSQSRGLLATTLPEMVGRSEASAASSRLAASERDVLSGDALLFESVLRGHATQAQFDTRTAGLKTSLEHLIQDARAVAGIAHLEYVLELRRVAGGASSERAIYGSTRIQQEAAEQVVICVLQLGQLVGKLDLARSEDELNSIVANELAQNLARTRTQLRVLVTNLEGDVARSERAMQEQFESVAFQISADRDAQSLVRLRRSTLVEAGHAAELRGRTQKSVADLSTQLDAVERIAADEARTSMSSAQRTLWGARGLSLIALVAALVVGFHSVRRMRASLGGLRTQNEQLESLSRDLRTMNEGLEGLVAERSAALVARERAMCLVLDAMSEGLISVDLEGKVAGESSKVALSWFGRTQTGTRVWQHLFADDERLSQDFQVGYTQVAEDILPFEVSAACMPQRFVRAGRTYSLGYRQVMQEHRFHQVLVIVNDITNQVESEQRERDAREQHQLLSHLLNDKQGLQVFVRESERLMLALRVEKGREGALRLLHTIKGNTAVFGMESVSSLCHTLEDALGERAGGLTAVESNALSALWYTRLARVEELLTSEEFVELDEEEFGEILSGLRQRRDYFELVELVQSWKWVKTSLLLRRLSAQVRRIAEALGKNADVRIEHNHLSVMPGALDGFWGEMIHLARNAVDHGLESPEERAQLGKPAAGDIVLCTKVLPRGGFCIELGDDGRGLDFAALRAAAAQRGLAATSEIELIEIMFRDGVTTRDEATEISGRGVGLGAVVAACRAAGGSVEVETAPGKGTLFRFVYPLQTVQVREGTSSRATRGGSGGRLDAQVAFSSPDPRPSP